MAIRDKYPERIQALQKEMARSSPGIVLEDRISELPVEVVTDILSRLKAKEAGRTSILSTRWRHMWSAIYNLIFDGSEVLYDVARDPEYNDDLIYVKKKRKRIKVERPIYLSCINQSIRRHQRQTVDQFEIVFSLDESSSSDIDSWVHFAVRKRVKRLKLDLRCPWRFTNVFDRYIFPDSPEISRCSSVTSLYLSEVNITGDMLELFLHNCLNLECLFVSSSQTVVSLNVDGPSLKLKWLELHICRKIEWLDISAPNLVSFKYTGRKIPMPLKEVPKLRELCLMGLYSYYLNSRLSELSSYPCQLEKLTLNACVLEKDLNADDRFPVFPKLKQLTLVLGTFGIKRIIDYWSMIKGCPSLYSFSFQNRAGFVFPTRKPLEACPHNIKVVEFNGFLGKPCDVEMATYLIDNAVMLEKITFDYASPRHKGTWMEFKEPSEDQIVARACAREIGKRLPPGVELVVV